MTWWKASEGEGHGGGKQSRAHEGSGEAEPLRPIRRMERAVRQQGPVLRVLRAAGRGRAPTYLLVGNVDTYQLIINTPTTIITFLLVALLQNTQRRSEQAVQKKLDAIADGLSDLMDHFAGDEPDRVAKDDLSKDIEDLRAAVGLEEEL